MKSGNTLSSMDLLTSAKKMRDVKVKHFPYPVVYEIIENTIVVFSVFNSNQDSSKLKIN